MKWNKSEIYEARSTPLAPLLRTLGYTLEEMPGRIFLVNELKGMVVKEHLWFWRSKNKKGNAIDFFVTVEKMTFHDAMAILTGERGSP